MTHDEVRKVLGQGDVHLSEEGDRGQVWPYTYGDAADPEKILIVLAALTLFAGIIALFAYFGNSHGPWGGTPRTLGTADDTVSQWHFTVHFDGEGKVTRVSEIAPCAHP